jgi:hypothetical protein
MIGLAMGYWVGFKDRNLIAIRIGGAISDIGT